MTEQLTSEQLFRTFERDVRPYILHLRGTSVSSPRDRPRFVSVGGQPGSGKGNVLESRHEAIPGSIVVNGDELRRFHPDYDRLMNEDHLRMPEVTAPASGAWVGMATQYLREHGISAVVETTLRNADVLLREFKAFRSAGFETELSVVAVPLEVSRLGTVSRFIEQVKDFGSARWTPGWAHDEAAANLPGTVAALIESGLVDQVVVQDRDGRIFYDAATGRGTSDQAQSAVFAVETAREARSLTTERARAWIGYLSAVLQDRVRLRVSHPDLAQTLTRLVTIDAAVIVPRAHPGDDTAQQAALATLKRELHRV